MADKTDFSNILSNYHKTGGATQNPQSNVIKRRKAVTAALSIIEAHALGGGGHHPDLYKNAVGPLADAIQEALDIDDDR